MTKKAAPDKPGFSYDKDTRTLKLDLYQNGREGKRLRKTIRDIGARDAERVYRDYIAKLESDDVPIGWKPTLRQFVRGYPRLRRQTAKSQRTAKHVLNDLLGPDAQALRDGATPDPTALGEVRLDRLDDDCIMAYVNARFERGLKSGTIRRRLTTLRALLREAMLRRILTKLPFTPSLVFKSVPESEATARYLTAEGREALVAAFDDETAFRAFVERHRGTGKTKPWGPSGALRRFGGGLRGASDATSTLFAQFRALKPLIVCLLDTGLRLDDARLLEWERVDMRARTIHARQAKTNEPVFIPMTEELHRCLGALDRVAAQPYVFVTAKGRPFSISRINRAWTRAKAMAGIAGRLRIHDCRHTLASALVQTGTPLFEVGQILGHKDQRSTKRYAHLAPGNLRSAMQNVERWKRGAQDGREVGGAVVTLVVNEASRAASGPAASTSQTAARTAQLLEKKTGRASGPRVVRLERATGLEPATSTLARLHSTN
jgi:integrase